MLARTRSPWTFLPLSFLALAACSDDDDSGGGPAPLQDEFTASIDQAQEVPVPLAGTRVRVTVTNRGPELGTFQSPLWFGFHDGTFDLFDAGAPASVALERLAEDGDADPLSADFTTAAAGAVQGTLEGELGPDPGPLAPGETVTRVFELDPSATENRFFSYASAILPSNDAFVANADPLAHPIFDVGGNFVAVDFEVLGTAALDAGTEVNDELPANTNFFGQTTPDTGTVEGVNIGAHAGYQAAGGGGILDDAGFAAADFTVANYRFLTFTFEELPAAPPPTGLAIVTLTANDTQVDFRVTATGLSGPAIGAHFHEGAVGVAGPIVLDLTGAIVLNDDGNFLAEGSLPAPAGFADDLRAGNIYVNVHTDLNPGGELRGQVVIDEAFTGALDSAQEVPAPVTGTGVRVTVVNRAPDLGTFQTRVWVGFHDGAFDVYDLGVAADAALERLAEDGDADPLAADFLAQASGTTQGTLPGALGGDEGEIAPGETVSRVFRLAPTATGSRFLGYASMIIPSNDAFTANGDPLAHPIFDVGGTFVAVDFDVPGSEALDAGTEVNDELPANTAFFGQTTPDTGTAEGGVVALHPGFTPAGGGGILDDAGFAAADFTAVGYELLGFRFREEAAGDPPTGNVIASLNGAGTQIAFMVFARDLSGPATAMHFHEAAIGVAGPIVLDLTDTFQLNEGGVLTAQGSKAVASTFVDALRAGDIYLNIHTSLNPTGELRGQVTLAE